MKFANKKNHKVTQKRALRVRKHLRGTAECPRLCVVKSVKHIHVQLIDDVNGTTLVSVSTLDKELRAAGCQKKSVSSGRMIGEKVAERALEKGVSTAIFDRGPSKYHGILAAVADAARQRGLTF